MKNWKTPVVETLSVSRTAHTIRWMNQNGNCGWHKFNNNTWNFCGQDYKPGQNDVIDGLES